jgi:hypothetical protein
VLPRGGMHWSVIALAAVFAAAAIIRLFVWPERPVCTSIGHSLIVAGSCRRMSAQAQHSRPSRVLASRNEHRPVTIRLLTPLDVEVAGGHRIAFMVAALATLGGTVALRAQESAPAVSTPATQKVQCASIWQIQAIMSSPSWTGPTWTQLMSLVGALDNAAVTTLFANDENVIPSNSPMLITLGQSLGMTAAEVSTLVQRASQVVHSPEARRSRQPPNNDTECWTTFCNALAGALADAGEKDSSPTRPRRS